MKMAVLFINPHLVGLGTNTVNLQIEATAYHLAFFLLIDETIASRAVFVIVFLSDGRVGAKAFGAS